MTSGVGRGRGWLNLNKSNTNPPGMPPPHSAATTGTATNVSYESNSNAATDTSSTTCDVKYSNALPQQYAELISLLNQLNANDDGILINQKFKCIIQTWSNTCSTSNEVVESFNYIYKTCLEDEAFAKKLVTMVSSNSFITAEISQEKIRNLFIGKLQSSFESSDYLRNNDPNAFRISILMLGEFYNRARLSSGKQLTVLAQPLLSCLVMLLQSTQTADYLLFISQLYTNGESIMQAYPSKMIEMLNNVRRVLICNVQLSQTCRLLLLLVLEIANNNFELPEVDICKFYQEQLGDQIMANFHKHNTTEILNVQTQQQTSRQMQPHVSDGYRPNTNLLQIQQVRESEPTKDEKMVPTTVKNHTQHVSTSVQTQCTSTVQNAHPDSCVPLNNWDSSKDYKNNTNREKTGRPILGIGSRFQKARNEEHSWRDGTSNWNSKQKVGNNWGNGKKGQHATHNSAWEHDDRYETDYS